VLRQRLAGHPGVHGVEFGVALGQLDAARRQQLPAGELQLVVVHVAHVGDVVADQAVQVALVLQGLVGGLRAGDQLDPPHVLLQGFKKTTTTKKFHVTAKG